MTPDKQEIVIETTTPKKHPCDLCGKGELGGESLHVGGYVNWAHRDCCKIGNKAIERYFRLITTHPNGTNILAEQLLKARGAKFFLHDLFTEKAKKSE